MTKTATARRGRCSTVNCKTSANVGAKEGIPTAHNEYSYDAKRGNLVEIRHNTDVYKRQVVQ